MPAYLAHHFPGAQQLQYSHHQASAANHGLGHSASAAAASASSTASVAASHELELRAFRSGHFGERTLPSSAQVGHVWTFTVACFFRFNLRFLSVELSRFHEIFYV